MSNLRPTFPDAGLYVLHHARLPFSSSILLSASICRKEPSPNGVCNSAQTSWVPECHNADTRKDQFARVSLAAPQEDMMWIAKHFRLSQAYSELESLAAERTAELQRLTQRLLRLQDEERRKLARDLHDTTGQTLAALNISVSLLQQQCKEMPAMLALVTEVAQHAEQAIEEIRTMSTCCIRHCWTKWDLLVRPSGISKASPSEAELM